MAQAPINFSNAQASGSDALGGAQRVAMNMITEPTGAVRRRPGMRVHPDAPASVVNFFGLVGIHRLLNGDLITVGRLGPERPIYRVASGSVTQLNGGGAPPGLRGSAQPSFAETEMLLVLAGGEDMQKVELATWSSTRLGGSPPLASHVIANSQRLLANDVLVDRTKVRYSSTAQGTTTFAGHEQWLVGAGTAGFFTAEARPDPVVAIGETTNEVYVFGQYTTEIYGPEPTLRFVRIAAQEVGCGAPASPVKVDEAYFWIDHQKRVVMGNGRSFENIGEPIQRTLDALDVSDAIGFRVRVGPCDAVCWTIPSSGQTFVYQRGGGWGQWSGFNGNWSPLGITGLTGTDTVATARGYVGQVTFDAVTDFGDPIRAYVESGFQNHDTDAYKSCKRVQLALRRGAGPSPIGSLGSLSYRDRPGGGWEFAGPIDLGGSGDTEIVLDFPSLGSYRRREWRLEFSGADDLVLVGASEEFEVTGY